MMKHQQFTARRKRLINEMQTGIAIIPTAPEQVRNRDSHYPYRFDSYFYYLTGFKEPDSLLVLIAGNSPKSILFCRDKNLEREIWDGFRCGPEATLIDYGMDEAYSIDRLDEMMPQLLSNQPQVFYSLGADCAWDLRVIAWLNQFKSQARAGVNAPGQMNDVRKLVDEMRLYKSDFELDIMRRSASIAANAHQCAMQKVHPGQMEYEVEADILREFYRNGAQSPAYTSIVAGGENACTLHYIANNCKLNNGDLLLIDAGCELDGYASDVTRTFPVNGKFSSAQKDLYELVLAAQLTAIDAVKPDHDWNAPHEAALDVLIQGMIDFNLCKGSNAEILETGAYKQFYMHRTGHWLGLDVHDAGEYKNALGDWRKLGAGMTLTVEPGCYVRPADNIPKHFWNMGIRIEDDVLVTSTGHEVLTKKAPKTVNEIESMMAKN